MREDIHRDDVGIMFPCPLLTNHKYVVMVLLVGERVVVHRNVH